MDLPGSAVTLSRRPRGAQWFALEVFTMRRAPGSIDLATAMILAAVVCVVIAIQFLPAVGRQADARSGAARVEAWGWNIAGLSLQALAPEFERRRPDVDMDVKVSGTAMQSRFLLAMASGRGAPDVMQLQEREAGKYTSTGRLADLTARVGRYERDFPASFWQSCLDDDGKVVAVPWDIAPCAVFYKRWIFARHGIDPDAIETWDDFLRAGQAILQKSNGQTKMLALAPFNLGIPFQMLMQQNGGGVFDDQGRLIFDSPANREALELIRRLMDSGIASPISTAQEANVSYTDDSIACYPVASWSMADIKQSGASRAGEWGVLRLPAFRPGGLRNSNQGGSVLAVPAQSTSVDAAAAFVEYALCTVDAQLRQFEEWSLFPAFLPALRDPRFDRPDPFFGGQHVSALLARDFERVPPLVRTRDWSEAESLITTTLYDWAQQRQDPATYLRETTQLLSRRLGRPIAPPSDDPARP